MATQCTIAGHTYVFDVDYGEESLVARIIVRSVEGGPEGLWLVDREGGLEAADDLPGFGPNPASKSGVWPEPPQELVLAARGIARVKNHLT
jgi:hypothetical protein